MEIRGINSANNAHLGLERFSSSPRPSNDVLYSSSSLLSAKKGLVAQSFHALASIPSKIWTCMTWVLETIFFCFSYAPQIAGKTDQERLENEQKKFVEIRDAFQKEKASGTFKRPEFKTWWAQTFNSLPQIMRERIVKESMRDNARAKGFNATDGQDQYIAGAYENAQLRDKALLYVRDLEMQSTANKAWDPIDDTQLPRFLNDIIAQLTAAVENSKA